jgi:hypothetical protein
MGRGEAARGHSGMDKLFHLSSTVSSRDEDHSEERHKSRGRYNDPPKSGRSGFPRRSCIVNYLARRWIKEGQRDAGEMTSGRAIEGYYGYYRIYTVIPRKPEDPIYERFS